MSQDYQGIEVSKLWRFCNALVSSNDCLIVRILILLLMEADLRSSWEKLEAGQLSGWKVCSHVRPDSGSSSQRTLQERANCLQKTPPLLCGSLPKFYFGSEAYFQCDGDVDWGTLGPLH